MNKAQGQPMPAEWKSYQEEAAVFFRSIGMDAETDVTIKGVRTSHDIDVLVKSRHVGFEALWIVECKHWSNPVSKLHVLGLREIVLDAGADKGILLCERGFQSGANEAATLTNVQLTSLSNLAEPSKKDVFAMRLRDLTERLVNADFDYWALDKAFRIEMGLRADGFEHNYSGTSVLMIAKEILKQASRGQFPFHLGGYSTLIPTSVEILADQNEACVVVDNLLSDLESRLTKANEIWASRVTNPNTKAGS